MVESGFRFMGVLFLKGGAGATREPSLPYQNQSGVITVYSLLLIWYSSFLHKSYAV